jgi:tetratricopeptide (TPR) repeat protein
MDRVPASGAGSWRFESSRAYFLFHGEPIPNHSSFSLASNRSTLDNLFCETIVDEIRQPGADMTGTPKRLQNLTLAAVCGVIVLSAFLCGCDSQKNNDAGRHVKTDPSQADNARMHYDVGTAHAEAERYADAIVAYEKAIALKPDYVEAHRNMGIVYGNTDRNAEALAAFNKILTIDPDNAAAHMSIGNIYFLLRKPTEAIAAYNKVIALKPNDVEAYNTIAGIYSMLGKHADSLAIRKKLISINPANAEAYCGLAADYEYLKKIDLAIAAYEKALSLKPDEETAYDARQALKRLRQK